MSRSREPRSGERGGEDFASRWSRMKRGSEPAAGVPAAEADARGAPPAEETRSDEEVLRELDLPDPDTLKPGDDVRGFMASAVPARIRNRALRRLWVSNPVLANVDGLVDYGGDFTDAAMVPAVLQTAYKVGRGWARDAVEDEPEGTAAEPEEPGGEGAAAGPEAESAEQSGDRAASAPTEATAHAEMESKAKAETGAEAEDAHDRAARRPPAVPRGPAPRRMRFRFADG